MHLNRKDFKQFGPARQYESVSAHTQESLNNSQRDLSRYERKKHGQKKFTEGSTAVESGSQLKRSDRNMWPNPIECLQGKQQSTICRTAV